MESHHGKIENIIPADREDIDTLSAVAMRSKAHWGYDEEFMAACHDELVVTEEMLGSCKVYLMRDQGETQGFYCFRAEQDQPELTHLFVEPEKIGKGYGRKLWAHLLEQAQEESISLFYIIADPFAEAFYHHMGATTIGEIESPSKAGRMLPLMTYTVGAEDG